MVHKRAGYAGRTCRSTARAPPATWHRRIVLCPPPIDSRRANAATAQRAARSLRAALARARHLTTPCVYAFAVRLCAAAL